MPAKISSLTHLHVALNLPRCHRTQKAKASLVTQRTGTLWRRIKNRRQKGNLIDSPSPVVLGAAFANVIKSIGP